MSAEPVDGVAEPLTPEEEAVVRRDVETIRLHEQRSGRDARAAEHVASRLLAALDAERASHAALRKAATRAALATHAPMHVDGPVYRACPCNVHSELRWTLAALGESQP